MKRLLALFLITVFCVVDVPAGTQFASQLNSTPYKNQETLAPVTAIPVLVPDLPSGRSLEVFGVAGTQSTLFTTLLLFFIPFLPAVIGTALLCQGCSDSKKTVDPAVPGPPVSGAPDFTLLKNQDEDTRLLLFVDPKASNISTFRIDVVRIDQATGARTPLTLRNPTTGMNEPLIFYPPVPASPQDAIFIDLPAGTRGTFALTVRNASGDPTQQNLSDSPPSRELQTTVTQDSLFVTPLVTVPSAQDGGPHFSVGITIPRQEDIDQMTGIFGQLRPVQSNGRIDFSEEPVEVPVVAVDGMPTNFTNGQRKDHFIIVPETLPDGSPFPLGRYVLEVFTTGTQDNRPNTQPARSNSFVISNVAPFSGSPAVTAASLQNTTTIQLDVTPTRPEARTVQVEVRDTGNQPVLDTNGNPINLFFNYDVDGSGSAQASTFFLGLPQTGTFRLVVRDSADDLAPSQTQTASVTATVQGSPFNPVTITTQPNNQNGDLRIPFDFNVGGQSQTPQAALVNLVELDSNGNILNTLAQFLPVFFSSNSGSFNPSGLNQALVDLIDPQTGQPLNVLGRNLAFEVYITGGGLDSPVVLTNPFTVTTLQSPVTTAPGAALIPTPNAVIYTTFALTLDPTGLNIPANSNITNYEVIVRQSGNVVASFYPPVDFSGGNPVSSRLEISVPNTGQFDVAVAVAGRDTQPSPSNSLQVNVTQTGSFLSPPSVASVSNTDSDNTLAVRVNQNTNATQAVFRITPQGQNALPNIFVPAAAAYDSQAAGSLYDVLVPQGITGNVQVEVADFHRSVGVGPFSAPQNATVTTSGTVFNTPSNLSVTVPDPANPHIIDVTFNPNNPDVNPLFGDANVAVIQVDIPGQATRFFFPNLTPGVNTHTLDLGQGNNNVNVSVSVAVGHRGMTTSAFTGPVQVNVTIASASPFGQRILRPVPGTRFAGVYNNGRLSDIVRMGAVMFLFSLFGMPAASAQENTSSGIQTLATDMSAYFTTFGVLFAFILSAGAIYYFVSYNEKISRFFRRRARSFLRWTGIAEWAERVAQEDLDGFSDKTKSTTVRLIRRKATRKINRIMQPSDRLPKIEEDSEPTQPSIKVDRSGSGFLFHGKRNKPARRFDKISEDQAATSI